MKNQTVTLKIISIILLIPFLGITSCLVAPNTPLSNEQESDVPVCTPLPATFSKTDLIGTWVAKYSGGDSTDKLEIRANGTYKQIFSSTGDINFESDWMNWTIEYHPDGYALLHLEGMRRCDGTLHTCNDPGGGLPNGDIVLNQCAGGALTYSDEVILFVTGYPTDVPKGIVLRHAKDASDWNYIFTFEE